MAQWIWENENWPSFYWDDASLTRLLGEIQTKQGELRGSLSALGMCVEKVNEGTGRGTHYVWYPNAWTEEN